VIPPIRHTPLFSWHEHAALKWPPLSTGSILYNQTPWSRRQPLGFQPLKALKYCLICSRLVYIVFWDYLTQRPSTSVQLRIPYMLSIDRIVLLYTVQDENGIVLLTETEYWHWYR
jgi:hypothetical protein